MTIFNSILHVVSEKKIIKNFSQSEAFMAPAIWLPGAIIASGWLKFQRSSSPILHGGWN
jgi:hypothetical protein